MRSSPSGQKSSQPTIYVTEADHERLVSLLGSSAAGSPGANLLRSELERAVMVRSDELPSRFVQLKSTVLYEDRTSGRTRRVQLVLPDAADIDENRISVFTPVGAALLGLTKGQDFDWVGQDGRARKVLIVEVEDGDEPAGRQGAGAVAGSAP
jgi:regulator of nucleoside diphosphate kinase